MQQMRHRHSGPSIRYRTSRGRIRFRKRPMHRLTMKARRHPRTARRFSPREQERHLDSMFRLQEEIKPLQQELRETAEEFNDISVKYWEQQLKGLPDEDNPFSDEHLSLSEERVALENKIFAKQETIKEEKEFLE